MPKQWYSGTGMHSRSCAEKRMQRATAMALLTMLWCVSVAPLGAPVVPLVNWMLIGSKQSSATGAARSRPAAARIADQLSMPAVGSSPRRTTQRSAGRRALRPSAPTPRFCSMPM